MNGQDEPPTRAVATIPVVPEDLELDENRLRDVCDRHTLPEHLALPLAWAEYHDLAVVLATTIDKLLEVSATDTEREIALYAHGPPPEDLTIPPALWCRTLAHVANRLAQWPLPTWSVVDLRSMLWTMKAFVEADGKEWTDESFERALAIARGELW